MDIIILFMVAVLPMLINYKLAEGKNRSGGWAVLMGFIFGWFSTLVYIFIDKKTEQNN